VTRDALVIVAILVAPWWLVFGGFGAWWGDRMGIRRSISTPCSVLAGPAGWAFVGWLARRRLSMADVDTALDRMVDQETLEDRIRAWEER
jgi:hypothetical protein